MNKDKYLKQLSSFNFNNSQKETIIDIICNIIEDKQVINSFDATELYNKVVKGGNVSKEFINSLIEAIKDTNIIYIANTEPSGFSFKILVSFAGITEETITLNADDTKNRYKLVVNRNTGNITFDNIPIKK